MQRFYLILPIILLLSCSKKTANESEVMLRYGEKILTYRDVEELIPGGISQADSIEMFRMLTDAWIRSEVLGEFAEERLYDTSSIDRKVKDYRNYLIVQEYLNRMAESQAPTIEESKVKEYYTSHRKELKLEEPLVRGVFLKINKETTGKEKLKELLSSEDPEKMDQLDNDWLDKALEYIYFRDKWVDWETIKGKIPYRFGDPDKFIEENSFFETDYGDCTYYLKITESLPTGSEQPYEFARGWISPLLTRGSLADYEKALVNRLIKEAVKDNKLEMIGYDPFTHEIKKK